MNDFLINLSDMDTNELPTLRLIAKLVREAHDWQVDMLKNLTETQDTLIRLLPNLTGGEFLNYGVSGVQSNPVHLRPLQVSTGVCSTYVVPGDWPEKPERWFAKDASMYTIRRDNDVEYLIDGPATYEAMVEAMETATSPDHFVVLLGWTIQTDFILSDDGSRCPSARTNLLGVLKGCVGRGAKVRVLISNHQKHVPSELQHETERLHGLNPRVQNTIIDDLKIICMLDDKVRTFGSHHQKILLVLGAEGLVGFLGGVDFNRDRSQKIDNNGSPLHDVHVRVRGGAAKDIMDLVVHPWNWSRPNPIFLPYAMVTELSMPPHGRDYYDMELLREQARRAPSEVTRYRCKVVKISQTLGNPELAATNGQTNGILLAVIRAIGQARKFIYMEEQYLWSEDVMNELAKAAGRIVGHIIILIPTDRQQEIAFDFGGVRPASTMGLVSARHAALKRLKAACGDNSNKVMIFTSRDERYSYIHAKSFIVDDELAIVGSANCNNRSYAYDSEVHGAIAECQ